MGDILALDGNAAIAYGVMKSKVELIAAYPITPQTPVVENLSSLIDRGEFDCAYINVESEHSALSALIGASATGVRTFTASASHGLALMHEVTGVASGSRLPIVMGVVSRALPSPCSLWCDHSDIMSERDQGWFQLFAKNPQEALDFIMIAYTVSEDERVLTPTMVDIDGFYVSHLTEPVNVPTDEEAGKFIGKFEPNNLILDVNNPYAINNLSSPEIFTEYKYSQKLGMDAALEVIEERFEKFNEVFGRKYSLVESYNTEDAETVIVCLGSMSGTVLHTVNELRKLGKKVGLVRVVSFRPFPKKALAAALKGINNVAVIDRISAVGSMGPLYEEVLSCMHQTDEGKKNVFSFVAGLGGRDINEKTVKSVFEYVDNANETGEKPTDTIWIDLKKE